MYKKIEFSIGDQCYGICNYEPEYNVTQGPGDFLTQGQI
jgi:hypothetical protein